MKKNNNMPTKKEVEEFLESLQWDRFTKRELEKKVQKFLKTDNPFTSTTCEDCRDFDYSMAITSQSGNDFEHLIDIEIYYLNMRNRHILVTGSEILDYIN